MKKEDQLALFGFEELTPAEREEMARLMSQEEGREAALWGQLKEDLRSLKEVPPCQLAPAHLREAILRQGIKPAESRPWWLSWTSAAGLAAAACFGAAAYMIVGFYSSPTKPQPMSVFAEKEQAKPTQVARASAPPTAVTQEGPAQTKPTKEPPSERRAMDLRDLVASVTPTVPMSAVSRKAAQTAPVVATMESGPEHQTMSAQLESTPDHAPAAAMTGSVASASHPTESIVVISGPASGSDPVTTSEVATTNNVVFGG
jgi:hypothetical protein